MVIYDAIVIGGGACGLACAVTLKKLNRNLKILVLEAGERLGKKLASTGNGQGNISNANMDISHYYSANKKLVEEICCGDYLLGAKLFSSLFIEDNMGRIYPSGKQASALVDNFILQLKHYDIQVMLQSKVISISKDKTITIEDGCSFKAKNIVAATGGKAQKQYKTDGSAYKLLTSLGHSLTNLYPSLVQLKTQTDFIKGLKGIRTDVILTAMVGDKVLKQTSGDLIFTDYGVSGNSVFYISPCVVDRQNVTLSIEFLPNISTEQIIKDINNKKSLGYNQSELLSSTLHNQLGRVIIKRANSSDARTIARLVKGFTLPVTGNLGFDYAQVTKGGINVDEVDSSLQSKLVQGLYLGGELLDVDGDCGGYNLHWAFSSGIKIAQSIVKKYD